MESSHYQLFIRPRPGAEFDADERMLSSRLGRIPGVEESGPGAFRFGEPDEHGVMEIEWREDGEIAMRVPRPWVHERGPQVFALIFMTAEWCDGEVFDPQIDDVLRKDVVLQGMVAVRQAERERAAQAPSVEPSGPPKEPGAPKRKRPWWRRG
jgi:hypothetical protein